MSAGPQNISDMDSVDSIDSLLDTLPTSAYASVASCRIPVLNRHALHLHLPVLLKEHSSSVTTPAMLDTGATALFINELFVTKHNMLKCHLPKSISLHNIDGTSNKASSLTHSIQLKLTVGPRTKDAEFLITELGPENIILGLPWFKKFNPISDWKGGIMEFIDSHNFPPFKKVDGNHAQCRQWAHANIIEHSTHELWYAAGFTYSTELAAEINKAKYGKKFEEMVPLEYHKHCSVFSEKESYHLPKHQPWDHTIGLKLNAPETLRTKVYSLPLNEQGKLDTFLKENLNKGYIVPSKSPMASSIFFVKKKDSKLHLIQDYWKLNNITIKNQYPLPLASDVSVARAE